MLTFPHKAIRARIIKEYMAEAGYTRAVCFTCGNAGRELAQAGVDTLVIGDTGTLHPGRWLTSAEVHRMFPTHFDATSGHLNVDLMNRIGHAYRDYLGDLPPSVRVPSGSGECLVCLKLAYPEVQFYAEYDVDDDALRRPTTYTPAAPLNTLVKCVAAEVRHGSTMEEEE